MLPRLLAVTLSLLSATSQARAQTVDSAALATVVDSVFAAGLRRGGIPGGAVVVVQHGRVILAKGYGKADVASGRPFDADRTIFPIASISKVFTATAVMQLVDRGRVDLAADVNRYLTSARVPATYPEPITVTHLLDHTSGLDELPGRRVRSASELVPLGRFLKERLVRVHPPGDLTSYSSYGMALAGLLLEDVSGEPYETYVRRHVWQPLGMTHTSISVPVADRGDLAAPYESEGDTLVPIPYELYQTPPTSSIVSTLPDMARFMIAHLQHGRLGDTRILSERAAARMQGQAATMHPRIPGWALGFQVDDANGLRIIEHGGDIGGFSALMTLLPDEDIGIFVVHHLEGTNLRFDVKRAILDRFFADRRPLAIPTPHPEDAPRLERFAGTYRASTFCHTCTVGGVPVQDFEVSANPDGTISVWDARWVEVSPRYFVRTDGRARLGFAEDGHGRIVALTAGSWRVLERVR